MHMFVVYNVHRVCKQSLLTHLIIVKIYSIIVNHCVNPLPVMALALYNSSSLDRREEKFYTIML